MQVNLFLILDILSPSAQSVATLLCDKLASRILPGSNRAGPNPLAASVSLSLNFELSLISFADLMMSYSPSSKRTSIEWMGRVRWRSGAFFLLLFEIYWATFPSANDISTPLSGQSTRTCIYVECC